MFELKAIVQTQADPSKQFGRRADIFYDQQNQRLALLDDVYYEGRENYTFDLLFFGQSVRMLPRSRRHQP